MSDRMSSFKTLHVVNAAEYAASKLSFLSPLIRVSELSGGVSSTVILLETEKERVVLKQSLPQLRVQQEWFCDQRRILQESAALRLLAPKLPAGSVPTVLYEDSENLAYVMTAAPPEADTWKAKLMAGECDPVIAEAAGVTLAAIFQAGWHSAEVERVYGDLTVFDELRLQPYFGQCAARHPDVAPELLRLIDEYPGRCETLVHGDWSPKNMLVSGSHFTAIDFEVIHFGDPAFDPAFLLNHLLLKSIYLPLQKRELAGLAITFWNTLKQSFPEARNWSSRIVAYMGGLLLARIDGKSPVEYLTGDEVRQAVRHRAKSMIMHPPQTIEEVFLS